ncbi:hypothetical protein MES4922_30366 [Mesorhizobium ventifaucium]|uniref:Uncharacterized protein n=1 Tax=Mesorhizobium ventifaucium TaxID=666020 RepID=A0ABM9DYV0_9HYPH|nr:hypothetical protein MES4922_30366 [Mesorhizobium ventifaucium]
MSVITTVEQLEALYGLPSETSLVKELDHVIPEYAAFIEASPLPRSRPAGRKGWIARRAAISPASSASMIRKP